MTPKEASDTIRQYLNYGSDYLSAPYTEDEYHKAMMVALQALEAKQQPEIVPIGTKVRMKICKLSDEMAIINYDANREKYICQVLQIQVGLKREEFEIIEP